MRTDLKYITRKEFDRRMVRLESLVLGMRHGVSSNNQRIHRVLSNQTSYLKYRAPGLKGAKQYRKRIEWVYHRFKMLEKTQMALIGGKAWYGKTKNKGRNSTRLVRLTFTEYSRLMKLVRSTRWGSMYIPDAIGIIR